jgi:hypothetical protein
MKKFNAEKIIRSFLPLLMLVLFGCGEQKQGENSLEKRQEAIAKEIVSIQYDFTDALFHINDTNAVSLLAKTESLTDRLDKISKELDTVGRFPLSLRKATLKKMDDDEKVYAKLMPKFKQGSLQPETIITMETVFEKYHSASEPVEMKAGLYYNGTDTNGVDLKDHHN